MRDQTSLRTAAGRLLPPGTGIGVSDPRTDHPAYAGEHITGIPKRLAEFRAGRVAARAAMAALGLPPQAVPMGDDRAPVWPAGVTGSITHSHRLCLVAVAPTSLLAGIGLDLEPAKPLDNDLRAAVLRPEEEAASPYEAKLIFCAKEAAYKAQYPQSRQLFDFHTLLLRLHDDGFTASFCHDVPPFAHAQQIHGRWVLVAGHFLCVATL